MVKKVIKRVKRSADSELSSTSNVFVNIMRRLEENQQELSEMLERALTIDQARSVIRDTYGSSGNSGVINESSATTAAAMKRAQIMSDNPFRRSDITVHPVTSVAHSHPLQSNDSVGHQHARMTSSDSVSSFLDDQSSTPLSVTIAEQRVNNDGSLEVVQRHLSLDDLSKEVRGTNVYSDKSKLWKLKRKVRKSVQNLDQLSLEKSPSKMSINVQPATPNAPSPSGGAGGGMFCFEPPTPQPQGLSQVTTESLRNLLDPKAHGFDTSVATAAATAEEEEEEPNEDASDYSTDGDDDNQISNGVSKRHEENDTELDTSLQRDPRDNHFGEFRETTTMANGGAADSGAGSGGDLGVMVTRERSHSVPTSTTQEMQVFPSQKSVEMETFRRGDRDDDGTEMLVIRNDDGDGSSHRQSSQLTTVELLDDPRYGHLKSLKARMDEFRDELMNEIDRLSRLPPPSSVE